MRVKVVFVHGLNVTILTDTVTRSNRGSRLLTSESNVCWCIESTSPPPLIANYQHVQYPLNVANIVTVCRVYKKENWWSNFKYSHLIIKKIGETIATKSWCIWCLVVQNNSVHLCPNIQYFDYYVQIKGQRFDKPSSLLLIIIQYKIKNNVPSGNIYTHVKWLMWPSKWFITVLLSSASNYMQQCIIHEITMFQFMKLERKFELTFLREWACGVADLPPPLPLG